MNVKFCRVDDEFASSCWNEDAIVVEVAVKYDEKTLSSTIALPDTANFVYGEVVPKPNRPAAV